MKRKQFNEKIKKIIFLLIQQDYKQLISEELTTMIDEPQMRIRIQGYLDSEKEHSELTIPPESAFSGITIIQAKKSKNYKAEYTAEMQLWVNNKESDLSIICDVYENKKNEIFVSLYDIVML